MAESPAALWCIGKHFTAFGLARPFSVSQIGISGNRVQRQGCDRGTAPESAVGNGGQCLTAFLALMAAAATRNLQLPDSKSASRVRIPLSPPPVSHSGLRQERGQAPIPNPVDHYRRRWSAPLRCEHASRLHHQEGGEDGALRPGESTAKQAVSEALGIDGRTIDRFELVPPPTAK
jgi:hypothetical protein